MEEVSYQIVTAVPVLMDFAAVVDVMAVVLLLILSGQSIGLKVMVVKGTKLVGELVVRQVNTQGLRLKRK